MMKPKLPPTEKTQARIDAIKAVWQDGMSAQVMADRIDRDIWGGVPTRNAIIGMFDRWMYELQPCRMMQTNKQTARKKARLMAPRYYEPPEPEKPAIKIQPKEAPKHQTKSTRNRNTGALAFAPTETKRKPIPMREDYELSEAALRKHRHEERMLERDRANMSSPAPRYGDKR